MAVIVYEAISRIAAPYVRPERVRQLIYAGLLAERGFVSQPLAVDRQVRNVAPIQTDLPTSNDTAQVANPVGA